MPVNAELLLKTFPHLSSDSILDSAQASKRYENNTLGLELKLCASILLTDHQDIKRLIELAIEFDFIIQPISSGNNWGYGSVAISDDKPIVLLDLCQLNKIVPISKELGLVSVEPGVTQQQLYTFLCANSWEFMTPVTGAGPTCSILSNALERGYGITPHTDHFASVNRVSAIFPNPAFWENDNDSFIYESGVSALDLSAEKFIDHTFKWGLGAYIDGLFTQSSMAIVTSITLRLAPKPQSFASFYIKVNDPLKLESAINFVHSTLRDFEGIVGSINLMDRRRLLSMVADNPNGKGSHKVMTDDQINQLAKQNDIPEWMIVGSIYGRKSIVKAAKAEIKSAASFADQVIFSDSLLIKVGKFVSNLFPVGFLKSAKEQLSALEEGIDIMLGKPRQVALPLAYWRNPRTEPDKSDLLNPDKDECGLYWYAPLIPMNAEKIKEFVEFIRRTTPKFNIEPLITFTNLKHDCIDSTIPLIFDVKNPQARKDAETCLNTLFEEGRKLGFVPYRMSVKQQKEKLSANIMHWKVVKALKGTLDPNNLLAPNRYNP